MQLPSLVAAAGLVAAATALLLPPDLPVANDDSITTLPVPTNINEKIDPAVLSAAMSQTIDLNCPGCLQFGRKHFKEIPSHLKLTFDIENTDGPDGPDRLTLNGYELYPNSVPFQDTLTAPVLPNVIARRTGGPRFRGGLDRPVKNQPLGFAMGTRVEAINEDSNVTLINVEVQIIQVGDMFIPSIPNVQLKLLKSPIGKLAIGSFIKTGPTTGSNTECATKLCRWKALFFEKLSSLVKGCRGSQRHQSAQPGHSHGPHHMSQGYSWRHAFMVFVTHILFPIMIGIVAGISASLIGMLVGTLIVFLWRTFVRRGACKNSHRCRYARKAASHERAVDEEKSGLLDAQEDLEAPPAYIESTTTTIVVDDKKLENES
ncbi:hypothetical protein F4808DRAFT_364890 [Astrocystis sublimbata]|nr:hypothetical protein F4808DRAFT_364890 [Astrocystis sublimbata]